MSARIVLLTGEIFGLISFNDGFVTCNGSGFRCVLQVERRIDLVYGGGSVGLTGLVSQAVHDGGRHVLGFMIAVSVHPDLELERLR